MITVKSERLSEIRACCVLSQLVYPNENIIIQDKPDLLVGADNYIEVVQADLSEDLDYSALWGFCFPWKKQKPSLDEVICEIKKGRYSKYSIHLTVEKGELKDIDLVSQNDGGHCPDYANNKFTDELTNKLEKLNNGNYGSTNPALFIDASQRRKGDYEAQNFENILLKANEKYKKQFREVFLFFTDALYIYKNAECVKITITEWELHEIITKSKDIYGKTPLDDVVYED